MPKYKNIVNRSITGEDHLQYQIFYLIKTPAYTTTFNNKIADGAACNTTAR